MPGERIGDHPIREFNDETEPVLRVCLFCTNQPPEDLPTKKMTLKNRKYNGWYSNAVLNTNTRAVFRFYVCPDHFHKISQAWSIAAGGNWTNKNLR